MTSGAHQIQVRGSPGAIECGFGKTFQPFAVSCAHSPPNSFSVTTSAGSRGRAAAVMPALEVSASAGAARFRGGGPLRRLSEGRRRGAWRGTKRGRVPLQLLTVGAQNRSPAVVDANNHSLRPGPADGIVPRTPYGLGVAHPRPHLRPRRRRRGAALLFSSEDSASASAARFRGGGGASSELSSSASKNGAMASRAWSRNFSLSAATGSRACELVERIVRIPSLPRRPGVCSILPLRSAARRAKNSRSCGARQRSSDSSPSASAARFRGGGGASSDSSPAASATGASRKGRQAGSFSLQLLFPRSLTRRACELVETPIYAAVHRTLGGSPFPPVSSAPPAKLPLVRLESTFVEELPPPLREVLVPQRPVRGVCHLV